MSGRKPYEPVEPRIPLGKRFKGVILFFQQLPSTFQHSAGQALTRRLAGQKRQKTLWLLKHPPYLQEGAPTYTIAGISSRRLGWLLRELFEEINQADAQQSGVAAIWEERLRLAHRACEQQRAITEAALGENYYDAPEARQEIITLAEQIIFGADDHMRDKWRERLP
ncbi:MAG: hypothetical protein H0T73_17600 [Ardenticatenales bacterium]|nr:hypothetical protein [Ardenticatenales bacterium]